MKKKAEIELDYKRSIGAFDLVSSYLGLEIYPDGTIYWSDEDDNPEMIMLNGLFCKYPFKDIIPNPDEMILDVYFNTKAISSLLQWYLRRTRGYGIQEQYLTNSKPDKAGHLVIKFDGGVEWRSNVYYKDSLKFIDIILQMNTALPTDYNRLRGLDICDRIDTTASEFGEGNMQLVQ